LHPRHREDYPAGYSAGPGRQRCVAGDGTTVGLTNQLGSVRSVLTEANGRLIRIGSAYPAGPPVRELDEALTAVRNSAAAGYDAIAARLGWDFHPPSPCHPA
jgi:hypothetical protein